MNFQGWTRFVSADVEPIESEIVTVGGDGEVDFLDLMFGDVDYYELLTSYRLLGATVVSTPAFPQCVIAPIDVELEIVEPMGAPEVEPPPLPMMIASAIHVARRAPERVVRRPEAPPPRRRFESTTTATSTGT